MTTPTATKLDEKFGDHGLQALAKILFLAFVVIDVSGCASNATTEMITTKEAPVTIGPFSQAIKFGNMPCLAGRIPIDPKTNQLNSWTIEEQSKLVLDNLKFVVAANGTTMDDVVSTTVQARLPRDVLVDFSAIAAK